MKHFASAFLKHHTEKDFDEEEHFCAQIIFNYTAKQLSNIKCTQDTYR